MRAWTLAFLLVPFGLAAQQDPPPTAPTNMSRAAEIQYAKNAAPAEISQNAKVWVLENGHYVVAEPGTSGVACMVGRDKPTAFQPQCGDAEADATILAIYRFWTEQVMAGQTVAQIKAAVTSGLASGRFRTPQRPALVYMQSESQVYTDADGKNASHFMPHLMVYYPNMTSKSMGIVTSPNMGIPGVVMDGTPTSALVVVVRDWTELPKIQ